MPSEKTIGEHIASLSAEELAQLYDDMLEYKIIYGTASGIGSRAAAMEEAILYLVSKFDKDKYVAFFRAHDDILRKQFLGDD